MSDYELTLPGKVLYVWTLDTGEVCIATETISQSVAVPMTVDQAKEVIAALQSAVEHASKGELAQVAIAEK